MCAIVYLCVYLSGCVSVCAHTYMSLCVSVCTCVFVCVHLHVCVYICVCTCVSVCALVCLCICVCVCTFITVGTCMSLCVSMYLHAAMDVSTNSSNARNTGPLRSGESKRMSLGESHLCPLLPPMGEQSGLRGIDPFFGPGVLGHLLVSSLWHQSYRFCF